MTSTITSPADARPTLTEEDIRSALAAAIEARTDGVDTLGTNRSALRSVIASIGNPMTNPAFLAIEADAEWEPDRPDPGDLWYDLRTSEARRLRELTTAAVERAADRCAAIILDELTAAGVAFAAEHPDAPRPEPAP
jgi:hypothetical protein